MAKKHEKKDMPHKRAKGGFVEKGAGTKEVDEKLAAAPHAARKSGGHVKGKHAAHRPDRRARGGATSDPTTAASKMSKQSYEAKQAPAKDEGGEGPDKD